MYHSTVHRVVGLAPGADGQPWYEVSEEWFTYFMPAAHLRPISPGEVGPIGGDPAAKRIEVYVGSQSLTAFEGDRPVLTTLCSTGVPGWDTPFGDYPIIDKRTGTRMTGAASDEHYNLPGVPFAAYITRSWIAILYSADRGATFETVLASPPSPGGDVRNWYPSLERPTGHHEVGVPYLVYTCGVKGKDNSDPVGTEIHFVALEK